MGNWRNPVFFSINFRTNDPEVRWQRVSLTSGSRPQQRVGNWRNPVFFSINFRTNDPEVRWQRVSLTSGSRPQQRVGNWRSDICFWAMIFFVRTRNLKWDYYFFSKAIHRNVALEDSIWFCFCCFFCFFFSPRSHSLATTRSPTTMATKKPIKRKKKRAPEPTFDFRQRPQTPQKTNKQTNKQQTIQQQKLPSFEILR